MDGPRLVVLVGLPASGKSTFYARHLAPTHLHISKDNWPNARRRDARQRRLVRDALAAGSAVALDNTNASVAERAPLIAIARAAGAEVFGYWFPPDLPGTLRRNAVREGRARVPDVGVYATLGRLVRPAVDEGFDGLYEVTLDGAGGFRVTAMST
ncbi:hypothetical protein Val02_52960 [Virgisporangium aliadipatigenens]|uniref:Kinase n=1 Tax=Virgisporangium aliadipatigenens TaxID=741659 RepID=A0A8J3YR46_9ACTN|nr:ATP-binding protein [Virgisporangium aliadipatigenens]GIJ48410.1 hypothetical protein Val02_52960 [Virgisporangium aliadipatigenens]